MKKNQTIDLYPSEFLCRFIFITFHYIYLNKSLVTCKHILKIYPNIEDFYEKISEILIGDNVGQGL